MAATTVLKRLPAMPYKGLSFYTAEDAPLFAGRETAVKECASLMMLDSTRILLLHGSTGCGKSSFLQAGLIPYLEKKRFQFDRKSEEAIFVTATWEPLRQLANFVYNLAIEDKPIETDEGDRSLGLRQVLLDEESKLYSQEEFIHKRGETAEQILDLLANLSTRLAQRFIVVIDQAEEVLTLRSGVNGDRERDEFFRFVDLFPTKRLPIKLLIALRTEYFGRFVARSRASYDTSQTNRDYYLSDLTQAQLAEAILKPTSRLPIPDYGISPFEVYRFSYEDAIGEERGVADQIAVDLKDKFSAGGALPVMQIVCANLYKSVRNKGLPAKILKEDYRRGQLEGGIASYVDQTLEDMCGENRVLSKELTKEMGRWKEVLAELASAGPDGTVTTRVLQIKALQKKVKDLKCIVPFGDATKFLRAPDRRLLRDRSVYSINDGTPVECFSLGHDAIGLVLLRWLVLKQEKDRRKEEAERKRQEAAREAEKKRHAIELAEQEIRTRDAQSKLTKLVILYTFRIVYGLLGLFSWIAAALIFFLVKRDYKMLAILLGGGLILIGTAFSTSTAQIDGIVGVFYRWIQERSQSSLGPARLFRRKEEDNTLSAKVDD
jgi:predicted GTPase